MKEKKNTETMNKLNCLYRLYNIRFDAERHHRHISIQLQHIIT